MGTWFGLNPGRFWRHYFAIIGYLEKCINGGAVHEKDQIIFVYVSRIYDSRYVFESIYITHLF
jgi:hypothetical protein